MGVRVTWGLTGLAAAAVPVLAVVGPDARAVLLQVICWVVTGLLLWRTLHLPQSARGPWYGVVIAGALFLGGGLVRVGHEMTTGVVDPFPSPADAVFAAGYISLLASLVMLIRRRSVKGERDRLVDALIAAAGVGLVQWTLILGPYLRDSTVSLDDRLVNVAFSVMTLALVAATVRLAVGQGARPPAYYLLAAAMTLLFVTDTAATLESVGTIRTGTINEVLTPPIFLLVLAAAWHPSARLITERPVEVDIRLTWRRLVLLGAALLMPAAVLTYQTSRGRQIDLGVVIVGSAAMAILVLVRFAGIVRLKEKTAVREAAVREVGEALLSSRDEADVRLATLDGLHDILAGEPGVRASFAELDDNGQLVVVASEGRGDVDATGVVVPWILVPEPLRPPEPQFAQVVLHRVSALDFGDGHTETTVVVTPVVVGGQLRGLVLVSTLRPISASSLAAIESIVREASMALTNTELTGDLVKRKSEQRFKSLVENSSDLLVVLDGLLNFTFISPVSSRLLGYPEDFLEQRNSLEIIHPEDRAIAEQLIDRSLARGPGEATELRLRHASGTFHWFEVIVTDLRDDPEIEGIVINAREIGDRKLAEQRLARSEARFRALVQNSSDLVAVVDEDGFFTYLSPAVESMLGYKPENLVGTAVLELLREEDVRRINQVAESIGGDPFEQRTVEVVVRDSEDGWHNVEVTISDLRREPAVGGLVLNARDITRRVALEHDLRHRALHDELTGLGNRAMLTKQVRRALEHAEGLRMIAVLFVDLDDFKEVNDSLGHDAGDKLLCSVADRVRATLRVNDAAARIGGDEFAVLIGDALGETEVVAVGERLISAIKQPHDINGRELTIGASIGVAFDHDRSSSADVLLRNADVAMYLAKDRGKGRVEVFEERMHATVFERLELKADLARAIEDGQLELFYQPIVSLRTGHMTGLEALARWRHPQRGLLGPGSFIPLAEDSGLIEPLGRWVLSAACQQLEQWRQMPGDGIDELAVAVNISPRQLEGASIVGDVQEALGASGLDAALLSLEITETTLMSDTPVVRKRLSDLRGLGVALAVDDFGIGYSSLGYIQRFPFDILKIDRSFVEALGRSPSDDGVIRAILDLAQELGVRTVAEGIEHGVELRCLQRLGCQYGQGYYFAHPVSAGEITKLLEGSDQVDLDIRRDSV